LILRLGKEATPLSIFGRVWRDVSSRKFLAVINYRVGRVGRGDWLLKTQNRFHSDGMKQNKNGFLNASAILRVRYLENQNSKIDIEKSLSA
jgi:hypothetical protein